MDLIELPREIHYQGIFKFLFMRDIVTISTLSKKYNQLFKEFLIFLNYDPNAEKIGKSQIPENFMEKLVIKTSIIYTDKSCAISEYQLGYSYIYEKENIALDLLRITPSFKYDCNGTWKKTFDLGVKGIMELYKNNSGLIPKLISINKVHAILFITACISNDEYYMNLILDSSKEIFNESPINHNLFFYFALYYNRIDIAIKIYPGDLREILEGYYTGEIRYENGEFKCDCGNNCRCHKLILILLFTDDQIRKVFPIDQTFYIISHFGHTDVLFEIFRNQLIYLISEDAIIKSFNIAVDLFNGEIAKMIYLRIGANPNTRSSEKCKMSIKLAQNLDLFLYIFDGEYVSPVYKYACRDGNIDFVKYFIDKAPDEDINDYFEKSAFNDQREVMDILLKSGKVSKEREQRVYTDIFRYTNLNSISYFLDNGYSWNKAGPKSWNYKYIIEDLGKRFTVDMLPFFERILKSGIKKYGEKDCYDLVLFLLTNNIMNKDKIRKCLKL